MGRNKKDDDGLLTPLELELMTVLWKTGGGTVHEVTEALPKDKDYAYTTISTVLRMLLAKGVVEATANGRQHTYVPVMQKDEYESKSIDHMVTTVFDGEPASLMRRLLDSRGLSKKELDEIRELLDKGTRR